jgi:NADH-quinone oxidoreductase subunit J
MSQVQRDPMDITTSLFYVFSVVLLFASFRVITARSSVYAALFLVLAFFTASCIWMLLSAEFLSIVLVLVYAGAVMVLFLFVLMMLDMGSGSLRAGFWSHFPLTALVGVVIALEMAAVLLPGFNLTRVPATDPAALQMGNTKMLGIEIYTQYLYPLQIAAVLLVVAIIAAIALTLRRRKDSKYQDPSEQVRVRATDRVRIVKMKAEVETPAVAVEVPAQVVTAAAAATGDKK